MIVLLIQDRLFIQVGTFKPMEKIGTAPIIIDGLSRCMQAFGMPRISRVAAIDFPHHFTQRGNYQECVSEDKDGFR